MRHYPISTHPTSEAPRLTSLVFRLPKGRMDALKELAGATRIRQSELLREGIADLLAKYADSIPEETAP